MAFIFLKSFMSVIPYVVMNFRNKSSGWNCSRVSWTRRFSANYTIFSLGRLTGMEAENRAKGYSEAERKSAMRYVCHVSSPCG